MNHCSIFSAGVGDEMKRVKIVSVVFLSFLLLTSAIIYGENLTKSIQVTYRNISILVNGKIVPSEQEPFIFEGRTFVPLRTIGEALNKKVEWDNVKSQIKISEPFARANSWDELFNYISDHYQIRKSTKTLSENDVIKIESWFNQGSTKFKLNSEDVLIPSFDVYSNAENHTVFSVTQKRYYDPNDKKSQSWIQQYFVCLKLSDGTLFIIDDNHLTYFLPNNQKWIDLPNQPYFGDNSISEKIMVRYYSAVCMPKSFGNSIDYTKELSTLFSSYLLVQYQVIK
jgi:hypothetical protein